MNGIQWDASCNVGIPGFDDHHEQIVKLVNILVEDSKPAASDEFYADTIDALTEVLYSHFVDEEAALDEADYPNLEQHIREHRGFLSDLERIKSNGRETGEGLAQGVVQLLKRWWDEHVRTEDMEYREVLAERSG